MDLLAEAYESRLVQFGENVQRDVAFICNCCGCCCEAMIAPAPVRQPATRSTPRTTCRTWTRRPATAARKCVDICPVEAMTLVSANDPTKPRKRRAELDADICLGCGVCTRVCPTRRAVAGAAPAARRHAGRHAPPDRADGDRARAASRTASSTTGRCSATGRWRRSSGVILRLPPTKQVLATQQMRSRYLAALWSASPSRRAAGVGRVRRRGSGQRQHVDGDRGHVVVALDARDHRRRPARSSAAIAASENRAYGRSPTRSRAWFLSSRWTTMTSGPASSSRPTMRWSTYSPWWSTNLRPRSSSRLHASHVHVHSRAGVRHERGERGVAGTQAGDHGRATDRVRVVRDREQGIALELDQAEPRGHVRDHRVEQRRQQRVGARAARRPR